MGASFGADLPAPGSDRIVVYLLGPGVGESQVVVFPDGRCMVVDCCSAGGVNLPERLLRHLGKKAIDLLVITHPDLDHVEGLAHLVSTFKPSAIWRYPFEMYTRELVAMWCQKDPRNGRYIALRAALNTIDAHVRDTGRAVYAGAAVRPWSPPGCGYAVHCLAPTFVDQDRVRLVWDRVVRRSGSKWELSPRFERLMSGRTKLGDVANALSLALVVEWSARRVLLAGDVENGKGSNPHSGWKGVLDALDAPDEARGHLVDDVDIVKVAHHGSRRSFHDPAWRRHARSRRTVGIVAPFATTPLPSDQTLVNLRRHCARLGISADAGRAGKRASTAGWAATSGAPPSTDAPCIAASIDSGGQVQLFRGKPALLLH